MQGCCPQQPLQHAGSAEGAATLTADLVDLGFVKTVAWIVLNLVDRDRSDVVVEVRPDTIALAQTLNKVQTGQGA